MLQVSLWNLLHLHTAGILYTYLVTILSHCCHHDICLTDLPVTSASRRPTGIHTYPAEYCTEFECDSGG